MSGELLSFLSVSQVYVGKGVERYKQKSWQVCNVDLQDRVRPKGVKFMYRNFHFVYADLRVGVTVRHVLAMQ